MNVRVLCIVTLPIMGCLGEIGGTPVAGAPPAAAPDAGASPLDGASASDGAAPVDGAPTPVNDAASAHDAATGPLTFAVIENDLQSHCFTCHQNRSPRFMPGDLVANCATFKSRVDAANPALSTIVRKAIGELGHSPGALFQRTDPEHARWITWITDGQRCN